MASTITPNLSLTTYDSTSASPVNFQTWFLEMDGLSPTANMNRIDTFAGNVSGSLSALQGKVYPVYVNASYVSAGYYEATGITQITAYSTNLPILLFLNQTSLGTTTLNINSLGTKTLQKISPTTGSPINLTNTDLKANTGYLFMYNGTAWVMIGSLDQYVSGSVNEIIVISGSNTPIGSGVNILSGITSGSYARVTVDQYGRVISGSPAAQSGHDIVDSSGSTFAQEPKLKFTGQGVTIADTSGSTVIDITSFNRHPNIISASTIMVIPVDYTAILGGAMKIDGEIQIDGTLIVL